MKNRLSLKSETLIDLSQTELSAVGGGAEQLLTQACVTTSFSVCVSVNDCLTGYCTWSLVC